MFLSEAVRRGVSRGRLLGGGAVLLALSTACDVTPPVAAESVRLRIISGLAGPGFHSLATAIARGIEKTLPAIRMEVQESPGSVRNSEALQRGESDLGIVFADVAYDAYLGRLRGQKEPFDRLRGIVVIQLTPVQLLVRPGLSIRQIASLRDFRVGIGPEGSGTALTARMILSAFGIDAATITTVHLPLVDSADQLLDGRLDAAFMTAGYPAPSATRVTDAGGTLLDVDGPPIERLRSQYPLMRLTFIPPGTYTGQNRVVPTIGVDNLLICRADLSEQVVYDLTKAYFGVADALHSEGISLRLIDFERAPATPIPLHAGAARYYRERELTR